jgi:hypothetical protein
MSQPPAGPRLGAFRCGPRRVRRCRPGGLCR